MDRSMKVIVWVALSTIGLGLEQSVADERDNIWWETVRSFKGTNQQACLAQNRNGFTVRAVFELSPIRFDFDGNPLSGLRRLTMRPYRVYRLGAWPNGFDTYCSLESYEAR